MTDFDRDAFIERIYERYRHLTIRELNNYCSNKTCGKCDNWMKSSQCPKERNVNGYSKGPSCNAAACKDHFVPKYDYTIACEVQLMRKLES